MASLPAVHLLPRCQLEVQAPSEVMSPPASAATKCERPVGQKEGDQDYDLLGGGVGLRATEAFLESPSFLYRLMTDGSRRPQRILLRLVPLPEQ